MNKILLTFLIISLSQITSIAQNVSPEILSSSGETYQGTNLILDWTIGELSISTIENSSVSITQGFHQPVYTITSISSLPSTIGEISVYPNPTSSWINLQMSFIEEKKVQIRIFDLSGKTIIQKEINGINLNEKFNFNSLPSGSYFLSLHILKEGFTQNFKIQKIK